MMKFAAKGLVVAFVLSFVLVSAGNAVAGQQMKVGTVNLQYILTNSKIAKSAQAQLQAKGDELQKNVQKERDKYETLKNEIEKKKTVWSQEILQDKVRELQKIEEFGKIVSRDANFELQSLEKKLMGPILNELGDVITAYGKREGYTLIMDNTGQGARSGILYADETLDISDKLLKDLDAALAVKKK